MFTFIFNQERNRERFAKFMASANLTFIFGEDPKILNYIQEYVQLTL